MVPERWQDVIELLLSPIAWIPRMQETLLAFFLSPASAWAIAARYVFLLMPALLGVAGRAAVHGRAAGARASGRR